MATAIASVLLTVVLIMVDEVANSISRNSASDNIEGAIRTIQGIVANRDLCDNALRGADAATRIAFNPTPVPGPYTNAADNLNVGSIYMQRTHNQAGATVILRQGAPMGLGFAVQSIILREKVPGQGRGTLILSGVSHNTYAAELAILINGPAGSMRLRTIPFNAVTDSATNQIVRCYQDSSIQFLCEQLGGTYVGGACQNILETTNIDCKTELQGTPGDCGATPANVTCENLYYVEGFTVDGSAVNATPQCRCQKVCRAGTGVGGVGGGLGAGPGAGATGAGSAAGTLGGQ